MALKALGEVSRFAWAVLLILVARRLGGEALDRTHLRFFTKRSAETMIREAGYQVQQFHAGATRMPALLARAWPTLCAVHLVFKIAPRRDGS